MRKAAAATRYSSYDSPLPSPSPSSSRRHPEPTSTTAADGSVALVAVRSRRGDLRCLAPPQPQSNNQGDLGSVLRKLIRMDKKPSANPKLPVPPAAIAPAKNSGIGGKLPGLSRKLLFQKGASDGNKKALTEVKSGGNGITRTLAMVLRSERELLSHSNEQEDEITALCLQIAQKDREVERLKDLCLRQREEIRTLKDAVLFPDPQPDRHVRDDISTLTGQIQRLAEELAQVKAEKHTSRPCFDDEYCSSPRTPLLNEETAFSLECSIGNAETASYCSPNEMFVKDLNPCLTPCISKSKSEEYAGSMGSHRGSSKARPDRHLSCSSRRRPMSKSSDHHKPTTSTSSSERRVHRSDQ